MGRAIYPEKVKKTCDMDIAEANKMIESYQKRINDEESFINDEDLKGEAWKAQKNKSEDEIFFSKSVITVMEFKKQADELMKAEIGDEILIEDEIRKDLKDLRDIINYYSIWSDPFDSNNTNLGTNIKDVYGEKLDKIHIKIPDLHEEDYGELCLKMEQILSDQLKRLESIDANTRNIFDDVINLQDNLLKFKNTAGTRVTSFIKNLFNGFFGLFNNLFSINTKAKEYGYDLATIRILLSKNHIDPTLMNEEELAFLYSLGYTNEDIINLLNSVKTPEDRALLEALLTKTSHTEKVCRTLKIQ